MTLRIFIFSSILFITHTAHPMEMIQNTKIQHQKNLSLEQNNILKKLSENRFIQLTKYGEFYTFLSKKDYAIFVTLPKELKEQIVHPSNKVIGVIQQPKYMRTVIQLQWIAPKNENRKKHLSKIIIKQNKWCCCT